MNASFDTRLEHNLFPEPPASFADSIQSALNKAGILKPAHRPWTIAAAAVSAVAVAASLLLVVTSAVRHGQHNQLSPIESFVYTTPTGDAAEAPSGMPTPSAVPHASMEPNWNGTTKILAAQDPDGRVSQSDTDRYAQQILAFLHEFAVSEPDELWILRVRPLYMDGQNDAPYVLVLAQSMFSQLDGPCLYLIDNHPDGGVRWATLGSSLYPNCISFDYGGKTLSFLYGTNTLLDEPSLMHITRGAITNGNRSEDIEFSVCISRAEYQRVFGGSPHYDETRDYFLVQCDKSDLNGTLELTTEGGTYSIDIQNEVVSPPLVTSADAARNQAAFGMTFFAGSDTVALNLTAYDDATVSAYIGAVDRALKLLDIHPDMLWICGIMPLTFPEEPNADHAYILAQYEFDGETGPELFYCRHGEIVWMTQGYDPFCANAVFDPIIGQNVAFGGSPAFDTAMREGSLITEQGGEYPFAPQLPLLDVLLRVPDSANAAWAREFFICAYPSDQTLLEIRITDMDDGIHPVSDPNVLNIIQFSN